MPHVLNCPGHVIDEAGNAAANWYPVRSNTGQASRTAAGILQLCALPGSTGSCERGVLVVAVAAKAFQPCSAMQYKAPCFTVLLELFFEWLLAVYPPAPEFGCNFSGPCCSIVAVIIVHQHVPALPSCWLLATHARLRSHQQINNMYHSQLHAILNTVSSTISYATVLIR
jgi:hypothetical protein